MVNRVASFTMKYEGCGVLCRDSCESFASKTVPIGGYGYDS